MKISQVKERLDQFLKDVDLLPTMESVSKYDADVYKHELFKKLINDLEVPYDFDCEFCEDTGENTIMETVYAGEPHQAPTGTQKCICRLPDADDYDDQE